tara:strand:+ start:192 stop:1109 length:918 start_codon:yes stop_codon:yes gene_type:complete
MSLDTYIVEGGIGKCVTFTSLIPKLAEKAGGPIQIVTPYIDIFAGNPLVKMCYDQSSIPLDDPRILESDNIYYAEPYKSNFVKGDEHLIESYCKSFGVDFDIDMKPQMFTSHLKDEIDKWKKEAGIKQKYFLVQFTGGQSPLLFNAANQYQSSNAGRNYPGYFAQGIINAFAQAYPDTTIVDVTLPNEGMYANTVKCDLPFPYLNELLKDSQGFIGIDSCLQHFAATSGVPGVVIWGNTRWTQFGWTHHKNMSFHDKNKANTFYKMDINDPRNIMVDTQDVIDMFEKKVMGVKHDSNVVQVPHKK